MFKAKDKKYFIMIVLSFLMLFFVGQTTLTQCGVVANNLSIADDEVNQSFIVNFVQNYDITNTRLEYRPFTFQKLTNEGQKQLKSIAKKEFNANYEISAFMHFKLMDLSGATPERINDFSIIRNLEIIVDIKGGQPNTANDAYCAIFVPLDSEKESRMFNDNDYSVFDNVKSIAKVENISATTTSTNNNKLVLETDAETDGFIFIMSLGKNKNTLGTVIVVAGTIISVVLVVLLIISVRSYLIQRRRKKISRELRSLNSTEESESKQQISAQRIKLEQLKRQQIEQNYIKQNGSPKLPAKSKVPKIYIKKDKK